MKLLLNILVLLMTTACAGPFTPFGAFNALRPGDKPKQAPRDLASDAKKQQSFAATTLSFSPAAQVLHEASDLTIEVDRPHRALSREALRFYYNGMDVTATLLNRAKVQRKRQGELRIVLKGLRLPSRLDQSFKVVVLDEEGRVEKQKTLPRPACSFSEKENIVSVAPFDPHPDLLGYIEESGLRAGYNPSMVAALVAQESGFNPLAVSWAKAIGLTQITPVADESIHPDSSSWPRHDELNRLPVPMVKAMIMAGMVDNTKDYRLNPQKSVLGGILYLERIHDYWSRSDKVELIRRSLAEGHLAYIVLSSYHSGPARVSSAIERLGPKWLHAKELRGAHNYVARVTSFCESFSTLKGFRI